MFIGGISPVHLGTLTTSTGLVASIVPAIPWAFLVEPLIFSNFQTLVDLGSPLIPGGATSAADLSVGSGLAADLSTMLNAPDLATLFDPADIGSALGTFTADIPTMLLNLIPDRGRAVGVLPAAILWEQIGAPTSRAVAASGSERRRLAFDDAGAQLRRLIREGFEQGIPGEQLAEAGSRSKTVTSRYCSSTA